MKSHLTHALLALLGPAALLAGCKESATTAKTSFTGKVQLYDERGTQLTDHSGVTVRVLDDSQVATTTAADGSFTLPGVDMSAGSRLELVKAGFGTYLTEVISTSSPSYSLARPVRMGKQGTATYALYYKKDKAKQYLIVTGVRQEAGATDTRQLAHRIYFDFLVVDVDPYPMTSKYSIFARNNLATGFSDTLRFSKLGAAGYTKGSLVCVGNDNPAADSCDVRYRVYYAFGNSPKPSDYRFAKSYPASSGIGPQNIFTSDVVRWDD